MESPRSFARRVRARVHAAALVVAAVAGPPLGEGTARAAPDAAPPTRHDEAVRLFAESRAQYRDGHFQRAVDLLLQARALDPAPVLLYNLGRAYEGIGDFPRAIEAYAGYVREDPSARDRGAIEERLRTLRRDVEEREKLERQRKDALKRQTEPRASAPLPAARVSPVPFLVAGVGVAGVGVGVAFALQAQSSHRASVDDPVQVSSFGKEQDARRAATVANLCFVAGGVVALGGITWGIVSLRASRRTDPAATLGIDVGPGRLVLRGTF